MERIVNSNFWAPVVIGVVTVISFGGCLWGAELLMAWGV